MLDQAHRLAPLLAPAAVAIAVAVMIGLALFAMRLRRGGDPGRTALAASALDALLLATLAVTLILVLGPATTAAGRRLDLIPFRELSSDWFDRRSAAFEMAANVLLFAPLAFLGSVRYPALRSWRTVLLLGVVLSLAIEGLQLALNLGREASVTDVLMNTTGAMFGFAVFRLTLGRRSGGRPDRSPVVDTPATSHHDALGPVRARHGVAD